MNHFVVQESFAVVFEDEEGVGEKVEFEVFFCEQFLPIVVFEKIRPEFA